MTVSSGLSLIVIVSYYSIFLNITLKFCIIGSVLEEMVINLLNRSEGFVLEKTVTIEGTTKSPSFKL